MCCFQFALHKSQGDKFPLAVAWDVVPEHKSHKCQAFHVPMLQFACGGPTGKRWKRHCTLSAMIWVTLNVFYRMGSSRRLRINLFLNLGVGAPSKVV